MVGNVCKKNAANKKDNLSGSAELILQFLPLMIHDKMIAYSSAVWQNIFRINVNETEYKI